MQLSADLNGAWSFAYTTDSALVAEYATLAALRQSGLPIYAGTVPGNFELDLQAQGLCGEPFYARNVQALEQYEFAHVWYARAFSATAPADMDALLVFEGVDCYATIYLNGDLLGDVDNMLIAHTFDVTGKLRDANELVVHICPAREAAKQYDYAPGMNAFLMNVESLHVRKAPHGYGWDIMPRALSAGLWRPVSLVYRSRERLEDVYLRTVSVDTTARTAQLTLSYRARTQGTGKDVYALAVEGHCGESQFSTTIPIWFEAGSASFRVEDVRCWWPHGYGEASLYDVTIRLLKNDAEIDRRTFRHGIRTVELLNKAIPGEELDEFCFMVNGERIFIRGTNWVPLDAYHSRDRARLPEAFALLTATHGNMIRCWGGNVYESDRFYEMCDEAGILVWQDFAMACAVYPHTPDFQARLAREATQVVKRLRQHACLALWSGDNECDAAASWGHLGDPNHNLLTRQVLPAVLRAEDPARPFLPSSPYIDAAHYNTGRPLPEEHIWIRAQYYKIIRDWRFRFSSEIGYHGCPQPASIRQFISPEHVWPYHNNYEWQLHSTAPNPELGAFGPQDSRVQVMPDKVRLLFGTVPETLDDFAFASQVVQGEALKYFIELARGTKWQRTGILWWNLLDGWPQFSDAVVDYYFRKKLAYDYICRAQHPLSVLIGDPRDGQLPLLATNDTRETIALSYTVTDIDTGAVLCAGEAHAAANSVTPLAELPDDGGQHFYLIDWHSALGDDRQHYLAGNPPFDLVRYRQWLEKVGWMPEWYCLEL